jgi:hypothetical protein
VLLQPKEIEIEGEAGPKKFVISKLPYGSAGREILTQYIPTGTPMVGSYETNHALYLKMMGYCSVIKPDGTQQALVSQALIDNHIGGDFAIGVKLETEMLEYNLSFFVQGSLSPFFQRLQTMLPQKITKMLMALQAQLSAQDGQHFTN